jgi:hypothetical protein
MDNPFVPTIGRADEPHPKQIAFEHRQVRLVLGKFGLSDQIPPLMQRFEKKWGKRWLTFESFFEVFHTFPIILEAHSFYRVAAECSLVVMLRDFANTFVFRRYIEVYARGQEEAEGRPIGMVFPYGGFQGGLLVHNGNFDTGGFKCSFDVPRDQPSWRVIIEPFVAFVEHLACGGWKPDSPMPRSSRNQRPRARSGSFVPPWIARLLGVGVDTLVLGWLLRVLCSRSAFCRQFVRRIGSERSVALTYENLGLEIGVPAGRVKDALRSLRKKHLIATRAGYYQGQRMTHILVDRAALRRAKASVR